MEVNQSNLNDIFKSYSARFNKGLNQGVDPNDKESLRLDDFAMRVPSSGAATDHTWLAQLPAMKKWEGSRTVKALKMGKITVVNEPYEATVSVPRTAIEDDSFGAFANLMELMGISANELWMQLAIKALVANGNWADGNPFFCSGRVIAPNITITNGVTTAFSASAVEAAIAAMRSWKLEENRPANVLPKLLIVSPDLASAARRICNGEIVAGTNGSESNPLKGVVAFRVSNELASGKWFLLGEVGGVRSVCVQQRKMPTLVRQDGETDENVFMKAEFRYGTDARGEGFLTLPFLAYAGGMSSVPAFSSGEDNSSDASDTGDTE